jgi:hypothetical protein
MHTSAAPSPPSGDVSELLELLLELRAPPMGERWVSMHSVGPSLPNPTPVPTFTYSGSSAPSLRGVDRRDHDALVVSDTPTRTYSGTDGEQRHSHARGVEA